MTFAQFRNILLDILFPPICLACKNRLQSQEEKSKLICELCCKQIEINNGFYCPQCLRRLPEAKKSCHPQTKFILAAVTNYNAKPARELIHVLKYGGLKPALVPWRNFINEYFEKVSDFKNFNFNQAIILPIPLYPHKEKTRGFNQAILIAELLKECLKNKFKLDANIPIAKNNLLKIKPTTSQTELTDYEARARNIRGSFSLANPEIIAKKNIILVDDVFTSGATMYEVTRLLKEAGAKKIIGFVLAQA